MNFKHFIIIIFVFSVLAQYVIFAKEQNSVVLHYDFQKGKSYRYGFVDNTRTNKKGGIPFEKLIVGISFNDDAFTIAIYPSTSSAISAQFSNMIFTKYYIIDKQGNIIDTRIAKNFKIPDLHDDLKCFYFVSQIKQVLSEIGTFAPPILLPSTPLQKDVKVVFANRQYIFQGMSKENSDIAKIKIFSLNEKSTHYQLLGFDLKRNIVIEDLVTGEESTESFVTQLKTIEDIQKAKLDFLINAFKTAITEEEFCLLTLRPFLNFKSKNQRTQRYIKRTAFNLLMYHIKEQEILRNLFQKDLLQSSIDDPRFCFELVDPYLYNLSMSGKKWAFDELVSKERNAKLKETYSRCFISIDGFGRFDDRHNFGKDPEKWKEWYKRIHKVLPNMKSSSNEALTAAIDNKDPWVRLFTLSVLYNRFDDLKIAKILKKASHDKDKQVREYAKEQLDNLKE